MELAIRIVYLKLKISRMEENCIASRWRRYENHRLKYCLKQELTDRC